MSCDLIQRREPQMNSRKKSTQVYLLLGLIFKNYSPARHVFLEFLFFFFAEHWPRQFFSLLFSLARKKEAPSRIFSQFFLKWINIFHVV